MRAGRLRARARNGLGLGLLLGCGLPDTEPTLDVLAPATSRHEGRLVLLTDDDLLLFECSSGADPVCTEVSHSHVDLGVGPMVIRTAIVRPGRFGGDGRSMLVGTFWEDDVAWSLGTVDGSAWTTTPIDVDIDLEDANLADVMVVDFDGDGIDELTVHTTQYVGC